jgi:hypothetical protein
MFNFINAWYYANARYQLFHDQKEAFWEAWCRHSLKPATWGLLYIANKHIEEQ